jgi:plasmid stabilization system protein ParE
VARVELAAAAVADLDRLIITHSLPNGTKGRVRRSLKPLARFPRIGPELPGRWAGFRFVLGPWRWMLIVYTNLEEQDRVVVVTIQDARSSTAATAERQTGR